MRPEADMAREIMIYRTSGFVTEDGDWDPVSREDSRNVYKLDELHGAKWGEPPLDTPQAVAKVTVEQLRELGCTEYSSYPHWQPHGWYSAQPYLHPYTGKHEGITAHLHGFSEEESRLIHETITRSPN